MSSITSAPSANNPKLNELTIPAGATLFEQGDRATSVFVILEGEMGIYVSGGSTLIASLSKGTSFGEQAVVGTKHRMATAKAIEDSKCLEIPANMLASEIDSASPRLKSAFDALTLQLLQKNFVTEMIENSISQAEFSLEPNSPGALALQALEGNRALNSVYVSDNGTLSDILKTGRGIVITDGEVAIRKSGSTVTLRRGGILGLAEAIADVPSNEAFELRGSANALSIDGDAAYQAFSQLSPGLKGVVKGLIKRALGDGHQTSGRVS